MEEPHCRRAIEPFPVASAFAHDRPNQSERSVHSPVAASVCPFCFGDRIDHCPIDTLEFSIGQIAIEPTQLFLVVLERGLVGLLSKPTNRCVLPESPWPIAKLLQPPDFAFQLVPDEARRWYTKAANKGLGIAQVNLGVMWASGEGGARDYVEAYMWFALASAGGNKEGRESKAILAAQMPATEIAEARMRALEWEAEK